MKAKLITAGLLFALAGVASASEPVTLSESQMDSVTAGGTASATALANATGVSAAATLTQVNTLSQIIGFTPTEGGGLALVLTQANSVSNAAAQ